MAHGLSIHYRIGMRLPATCTTSGKALVASLSDDAIAERYGGSLETLTKRSIVSLSQLLDELAS